MASVGGKLQHIAGGEQQPIIAGPPKAQYVGLIKVGHTIGVTFFQIDDHQVIAAIDWHQRGHELLVGRKS